MEVDGVRQLLQAANASSDNAVFALKTALQEIEAALTNVMIVRQSSIDPLGGPFLHDAIAAINTAIQSAQRAKQSNEVYIETL